MKKRSTALILTIILTLLNLSSAFAAYSNQVAFNNHRSMKGTKYYYINPLCNSMEKNAYINAINMINASNINVTLKEAKTKEGADIIMTAWKLGDGKYITFDKNSKQELLNNNQAKNFRWDTLGLHIDANGKLFNGDNKNSERCILILSRSSIQVASLPGNGVTKTVTTKRTALHELGHALGLRDQQRGAYSIMLQTAYASKELKNRVRLESLDLKNLQWKYGKRYIWGRI